MSRNQVTISVTELSSLYVVFYFFASISIGNDFFRFLSTLRVAQNSKAHSKRRSTHAPNLVTDEFSTAEKRRLNHLSS